MSKQASEAGPPKTLLTSAQRARIVEVLTERGVTKACPMCGQSAGRQVVDGYATTGLHADPTGITLGGRILPTVQIVCKNCGFVSLFSLGRLGLMNEGDS